MVIKGDRTKKLTYKELEIELALEGILEVEEFHLSQEYNCCVMFYEMKYTGKPLETIKSKYGNFTFIGCIEADVMDI